jgi:chromosome segregation ATPase
MESWHVALLSMAGILAGMMIPLLLQLRASMRELQLRVRETSERLAPVIDDVAVSARRVRRATDGIEGHEHEIGELIRSTGDLTQTIAQVRSTIDQVRGTAQMASAVATAAAAAYRSFREVQNERAEDARGTDDLADADDGEAPSASSGRSNGASRASSTHHPNDEERP